MKNHILTLTILGMAGIALAQNSNPWPSTGNVGIGTNSPATTLHVSNPTSSTYGLRVDNSYDNLRFLLGTTTGGYLNFQGKMINSETPYNFSMQSEGGNIGIGTLNPAYKLVVSNGGALGLEIDPANDSGNQVAMLAYNRATTSYKPFTIDAAKLILNTATNGNVGIGTSDPLGKLHISLNGAQGIEFMPGYESNTSYIQTYNRSTSTYDKLRFYGSGWQFEGGNVGIGTNSPLHKLVISNNGSLGLEIDPTYNSGTQVSIFAYNRSTSTYKPMIFDAEKTIFNSGNVGIGTTNPTEKLAVNGTIRSKEVKVEATGWPDYVFEENYQITSLEKTAQFIKENKHLPGIPSAKQVEQEGISLGEMNAKLLQKIEEMTLHMIEMKREIEILKKERIKTKR